MPLPIEDYAVVGEGHSVALVGRDGSIDWLCVPRFDSDACFAALLGDDRHGRWRIAPAGPVLRTERRYRGDTMVLETTFETVDGVVRIVDFMPTRRSRPSVVRIVEGVHGRVPMRLDLTPRFDYGRTLPWVHERDGIVTYMGGDHALVLQTPVPIINDKHGTQAEFSVAPRTRAPFALSWFSSWEAPPARLHPFRLLAQTEADWLAWSARSTYRGEWGAAVMRSLLVLKALTHAPTGAIVAAATTSLPEQLGGVRNWDYRYCWIRDAVWTVNALDRCGYHAEVLAYRDWMLRAVAGEPSQLQTVYGPTGQRRLTEHTISWLPGYEGSSPVRVGNAAVDQFQLDVYGEVIYSAYLAQARAHRRGERRGMPERWEVELGLLDHLTSVWHLPDEGVWEGRGPRRHFTYSKVMAWFAFTCAARTSEHLGLPGPIDEWHAIARRIHAEVCERGYDPIRNTFTQSYGSRALDANLIVLPILGFLPVDDPRIVGTVAAVERELMRDGLLLRYATEDPESDDGLPPGEGAFLACSFALVCTYAMMRRTAEARALFERLLALRNDVGLLSEEYDSRVGRMVGNFPQALSHLTLINAALHIEGQGLGSDVAPAHDETHDGVAFRSIDA